MEPLTLEGQEPTSSSNDQEEVSLTLCGQIGIQCATPPVAAGPPSPQM